MTQRQDDKYVWNDEQPEVTEVLAVEHLQDFDIRLQFSNGEVRELNLARYLHGPVFEPLRQDPKLFRQMRIEGGTIAWPNGADIAPETLYEDSRRVQAKSGSKRSAKTGTNGRPRAVRAGR